MRGIIFVLFILGLLTATVVDVGGGSGSHQVVVKTGETVKIVNVSESPSLGIVNEKGEEMVVRDGGGMPSSAQQVQAAEITPSSLVVEGEQVKTQERIAIQTASANMVVVKDQNRVYVSDGSVRAEVRTRLRYQEEALVSTESSKEIKIAPSVAVEAIPAKAEITAVELTDDGTSPAYKVSAVSTGNLFFLIPARMEVKYRIDATNGVVVSEEKPWWSFLVWS